MPSYKLRRCPTCAREFTPEVWTAMGLRNGEVLNALCPEHIGPSDIDNVLHVFNGDKVAFFEYKDYGALPRGGQQFLLDALAGEWQEAETGRQLNVRYWVLPAHPDDPESVFSEAIAWLWP